MKLCRTDMLLKTLSKYALILNFKFWLTLINYTDTRASNKHDYYLSKYIPSVKTLHLKHINADAINLSNYSLNNLKQERKCHMSGTDFETLSNAFRTMQQNFS